MKEIFIIDDTLANKISYYHLLAFLAALPFNRFYSSLILFSLLLHELIHFHKQKLLKLRMPMLVTGFLYLLTIIGTIYSHNKEQAFNEMEKQLGFILFPFIISVTSLDISKYGNRLLKAFTLTCIVTVAYLYIDALRIINYNKLPLSALISKQFINQNFSYYPFDLHATILSMYITICIAYLLKSFINSAKIMERLLCIGGLLFLMAAILQLSSRAVFLALLIIINIAFPLLMLQKKARWNFVVISLVISLLLIAGITQIESFNERYIMGSTNDMASAHIDLLEPRMLRWHYALELVKKSPLIGYGSGTEVSLLKEMYFEKHLFNSYLHALNVHNQYLSFLLKTGIIGLFIYTLILYAALKKAILARDLVFCSFVIVTAIVSFSENILDINKGIFFFSFFYCFFIRIGYGRMSEDFSFARPGRSQHFSNGSSAV